MESIPKIANGTFTLTWPDGQRHRTFKIKTQAEDAKFAPGQRVISLMIGRDNENDYSGFGFVTNDEIRIWRAIEDGSGKNSRLVNPDGKLLAWVDGLWALATVGERSHLYEKGYRLLAEERCVICNRKLTNPESIRTKIGPECAKRHSSHH